MHGDIYSDREIDFVSCLIRFRALLPLEICLAYAHDLRMKVAIVKVVLPDSQAVVSAESA